MKASEEFKVGKNNIGYVGSTFTSTYGKKEFEERETPTFQKTPRSMTDAEIESELKPGFCELGDVLAFIKNPPEGSKDGWSNLFYFEDFVVFVDWSAYDRYWHVDAWYRGEWGGDRRVFSPARSSNTQASELSSSETSDLDSAIALVKGAGYKIFKEI